MALTGKLEADFAPFSEACKQAEVSLKGVEDGGAQAEEKLNRVANSLSGTAVIQRATLLAEAVERVGGVSTLTEKELAKVSSTAQEAAEKLRAMGQDVPPGIQRIADAGAQTSNVFIGMVTRIAETAAGFITAEAAIRLVEGAFDRLIGLGKDLFETALTGSSVATVAENFERLTANAGMLGDTLMGTLRAGTHNTISDFDLMKLANRDLGAGLVLTDQQFRVMTTGAFALAQVTGTSVTDALNTMNDALLKGVPRQLGELTGKINLADAETKYANAVGKTSAQLSDAGKLDADRLAMLDAIAAGTARVGVQTDGLGEKVDQAKTAWVNFRNELGQAIATSSVLNTALDGIKSAIIEAFGGSQQAAIDAIVHGIENAAIALIDLGQTGISAAGFLVKEYYAVVKLFGDLQQTIDGVGLALLYLDKGLIVAGKLTKSAEESTKAYEDNDAAINKLLVSMNARTTALHAADEAQAGVDVTTAKYNTTLELLHNKMTAARESTYAFIGPLEQTGVAADKGAGGVGNLNDQLFKTPDLVAAAADAIKKHWDAVAATMEKAMGMDAVQKATVWADAIHLLGDSISTLSGKDLAELKQAMLDGIDGLARMGVLTGEASSRFAALAVAVDQATFVVADATKADAAYRQSLYDEAVALDKATAAQAAANEEKRHAAELAAAAAAMAAGNAISLGNVSFGGTPIDAAYIQAHQFDPGFQQMMQAANIRNAGGLPFGSGAGSLMPHFAEGGPVTSDGPIFAHAGEYVLPANRGGGAAGATVINHIYVNGTAADVARQVAEEILRTMKAGGKFNA